MEKKPIYVYNIKTHVLHLIGCCPHGRATVSPAEHKVFATSKEVSAFAKNDQKMCKLCSKRHDVIWAKIDISKFN